MKSIAVVALSCVMMACDSGASSNPQAILNPSYTGGEKKFIDNMKISVTDNKKVYTYDVEKGNSLFHVVFDPVPFEEMKDELRVDYKTYGVIQKNQKGGIDYLLLASYPENMSAENVDQMASALIWPLLIRKEVSIPEGEAVAKSLEKSVKEYIKLYVASKIKTGQEQAKAQEDFNKYKLYKDYIGLNNLPRIEVVSRTDPKDEKLIYDVKVYLKNGNYYKYIMYENVPDQSAVPKTGIIDKNSVHLLMFLHKNDVEKVMDKVGELYNEVKNDTSVNEEKGDHWLKEMNKVKRSL